METPKDAIDRLAMACEVFARQWRGGNPPGHDATIELHRAFKKTTPQLIRPELDQAERIRELEQRLAALDWTPITPENLPKVGDEIGGWFDEGWAVLEEDAPVFYDSYKENGWTHFRPIGAPDASKR